MRGSNGFWSLAELVREHFTFRDLCFEHGPGRIGVIVPNIDLEQGSRRHKAKRVRHIHNEFRVD